MKKANNGSVQAISKQVLIATSSLLPGTATAAEAGARVPVGDVISFWLLTGALVVLIGITVSVLRSAMVTLRENGKSLELSFPTLRSMAMGKGKMYTAFLFLILLSGVVWALAWGSGL